MAGMSKDTLLHFNIDSKRAFFPDVATVGNKRIPGNSSPAKYDFIKVLCHKFQIIWFMGSGGSIAESVGVEMIGDIVNVG